MGRVLCRDGIVFLRNYSFENLASLHYLQFFPDAFQRCRETIWTRDGFVERFATGGFSLSQLGTVKQQAAPDFTAYISKIANRVYSDLADISDNAFERGLADMKDSKHSFGDCPVMEEVDYFVFMRHG